MSAGGKKAPSSPAGRDTSTWRGSCPAAARAAAAPGAAAAAAAWARRPAAWGRRRSTRARARLHAVHRAGSSVGCVARSDGPASISHYYGAAAARTTQFIHRRVPLVGRGGRRRVRRREEGAVLRGGRPAGRRLPSRPRLRQKSPPRPGTPWTAARTRAAAPSLEASLLDKGAAARPGRAASCAFQPTTPRRTARRRTALLLLLLRAPAAACPLRGLVLDVLVAPQHRRELRVRVQIASIS